MKSILVKLYYSSLSLTVAFGFLEACSVEPSNIRSGVFIDSPVEGLMFQAGQIQGRTDQEGTFYYQEGDTITFSIEGVVIGEAALAKEIMTPINLVSDLDSFVTHPKVTNIARFLQSLDEDQDPDNGITLSTTTREAVKSAFTSIDFSEGNFVLQVGNFFSSIGTPLSDKATAQAHFFSTLASQKILPVDLIFLGDGFTNGTQSTSVKIHDTNNSADVNVHKDTQVHGYAQLVADQIRDVVFSDFEWNNPLLKMDLNRVKFRELVEAQYPIPYNLGVHGTTVESLKNEAVGSGNKILDEITKPVPGDLTQLGAVQFVASQVGHENRMKLFILWIGIEDVLGALTAEGGGALTEPKIDIFLNTTHTLESVEKDLDYIVGTLTTIPNSYVFLATIPDITRTGALFYKEDLKALATFNNPSVTALNGKIIAIGFKAFQENIASYLTSDNSQLNVAIDNLDPSLTLTSSEATKIQKRISDINDHINGFSTTYPNLIIVDLQENFNNLYAASGQVTLPNGVGSVGRGYGQGFFSMDGIYPSHTGYALIAREFLRKINDSNIGISIDLEEFDQAIETIWASDPYRDNDGDGFPLGPGIVPGTIDQTIIDTTLAGFVDGDDEDPTIFPMCLTTASPC